MNLKSFARTVGKSVPFTMTLQRKYGLPVREDYSEGYAVLAKKILYLSICSIPIKDTKALLGIERRLLELLKVDSLYDSADWFESLCTMKSGPTRLLLTGYDIGHAIFGNTVQTGLDFSERESELFDDHEMGSDALLALNRYAKILAPIHRHLSRELPLIQQAEKWCRRLVGA